MIADSCIAGAVVVVVVAEVVSASSASGCFPSDAAIAAAICASSVRSPN